MGWFGRKRRSESRVERPRAVERSEKQNVQQGAAMYRTRSNSRRNPPGHARRQASARSAGMKIFDLGKELSDSSPVGTLSSGEHSQDRHYHRYKYFQRSSREDITALPGSRELNTSPHLRPAAQDNADIPYNFHLHSQSHTSMQSPHNPSGNGRLQRQSSKRAAQDAALPKRKSTKRRKDNHVREEEIRAMSAPVHAVRRPGTYNSSVLRKDSKRLRDGLNRRLERPESNISLPMEESIHSSMSGNSDPYSYHVSRLNVFAPRPLIRSSFHPQAGINTSIVVTSRTDSRQGESRSQRKTTPTKEILKHRKTVSELADDLDSSDIRAALERDQRRKEAKRVKDAERLMKKLERRAEKQRLKEAGVAVGESPKRKRKNLDKHLGLGIESPQLTEFESPKRKKKDLEKHLGEKISNTKTLPRLQTSSDDQEIIKKETYLDYTRALQLDSNLNEPITSSPPEQTRPAQTLSEADLLNIHPAHRPQGSSLSLTHEPELITASSTPKRTRRPTSPQRPKVNYSPESIEALPPLPLSPNKADAARTTSRRSSRGFMSFFRRGPSLRNRDADRGRKMATSSDASFSNASRESVPRNHFPANLPAASASATSQQHPPASRSASQSRAPAPPFARTGSASTSTTTSRQVRDRSGTPVRTMSKFREDLPELPLSPPDSRLASPAAESGLSGGAIAIRRGLSSGGVGKLSVDPSLPLPSDGSGSGAASLNTEDKAGRSANLMSTSLASVDSEGSWLSGKPSKKASVRRSARNSLTSNSAAHKLTHSPSYEDLGMAEDEYFTRLTPEFGDRKASGQSEKGGRKPSSSVMATPMTGAKEEDEGDATENEEDLRRSSIQKVDDADLKRGDVGKLPRLIHREPMKSREGLLNEFQAQGSTPEGTPRFSQAVSQTASIGLLSPEPEDSPRLHPTEDVETPDPTSPATDAGTDTENVTFSAPSPEPITIARASSIKMQKEQASPKLLNIPARRTSAPASEATTPRKLSRDVTPRTSSYEAAPANKEDAVETEN